MDYAGCWRGDFTVSGKSKTFHACKDNIESYKVSSSLFCFSHERTLPVPVKILQTEHRRDQIRCVI